MCVQGGRLDVCLLAGVSRLRPDAQSVCRLEATEGNGHIVPVEMSGADFAGVK